MKILRITVLIVLLLSAIATSIFAAVSNPADTYVRTTSGGTAFGTTDSSNLQLNSGGLGSCDATDTIYLRWNLSGIDDVVGPTSTLKLTSNDAQAGNTGSVSLYKVVDDSWSETTLTNNTPAPTLGSLIVSVSIPTTSPGTITFTGQNLADYLNETTTFVNGTTDTTAGDDVVSFALRITGCTGFTNSVRFDAKDGSGTAPTLDLFNPTAITLSTLTATAGSATPYPLLAALIGLTAAALVWMRRR